MGVYIDMKMPTRCGECSIVQKTKSAYRCPLASKAKGFSCVANFGSIGIPEHCPLISVPEPHGRLIDADAFKRYCQTGLEDNSGLLHDGYKAFAEELTAAILQDIDEQPTIIPAEEGE